MFISCRRAHIDLFLNNSIPLMKGRVLDIGGKKIKKRGNFIPPPSLVSWEYVNSDPYSHPDHCCDACNIPLDDKLFDTVLLCELLEHVETPEKVLEEAARVLKSDGIIFITIPFLIAYHPDSSDYQRYTHEKLNMLLENLNFNNIKIFHQGSFLSVILDLFNTLLNKSQNYGSKLNRMGFYILRKIGPYILKLDTKFEYYNSFITTGYGVIAHKK